MAEPAPLRVALARLLLVDDDHDAVEVLGELLRFEGHEVRTACTGEEGLELLRAAPLPDVVVLDVEMPVLGGPGMANRMFLHGAGEEKVPVILVSGRADLAEIAGRMGTRYFVQKPPDFAKFLSVLGKALDERSPPSSA
jgi:CheY-like chemotaxis protein